MILIQNINTAFESILNLIYPRICQGCGEYLILHENHICTSCLYELPRTNFHTKEDNPVARLFWGRTNIKRASSFFYFNKGGKYQKLIHKFKYQGKKEIGYELGRQYGFELKSSKDYSEIDIVIPVPLHHRKEKARGFNQSEVIAQGIADVLGIQMKKQSLTRIVESETQTRKSRYERWQNVNSIFKISKEHELEGKHILIVDDVVTTGSTLEACANKILEVSNTSVSIVTLAVA
jgi:ComF family protein